MYSAFYDAIFYSDSCYVLLLSLEMMSGDVGRPSAVSPNNAGKSTCHGLDSIVDLLGVKKARYYGTTPP